MVQAKNRKPFSLAGHGSRLALPTVVETLGGTGLLRLLSVLVEELCFRVSLRAPGKSSPVLAGPHGPPVRGAALRYLPKQGLAELWPFLWPQFLKVLLTTFK